MSWVSQDDNLRGYGLDALVAGKVGSPGSATDTALRLSYVPKWKPSTAYTAGEPVVNPSGQLVTANTTFTSGTTYSATNWTVTAGGSGGSATTVRTLDQYSSSAVGDDWGPALQAAFDDIATAGGRTQLHIPGSSTRRYIRTPVSRTFGQTTATGKAQQLLITGEGQASALTLATDASAAIDFGALDGLTIRNMMFRGTATLDPAISDCKHALSFRSVRQVLLDNVSLYGLGSRVDGSAAIYFDVSSLHWRGGGSFGCGFGGPGRTIAGATIRGEDWLGLRVEDWIFTDFGIIDGDDMRKQSSHGQTYTFWLREPRELDPAASPYMQGQVALRNVRTDEGCGNALRVESTTTRIQSVTVDGCGFDGPSAGTGNSFVAVYVKNVDHVTVRDLQHGLITNYSHNSVQAVNCGIVEIDHVRTKKFPGDVNGVGYGNLVADTNTGTVIVRNSPNMDTTGLAAQQVFYGYAGLDSGGKVPVSQLPSSATGPQGATGTPGIGLAAPIISGGWTSAGLGTVSTGTPGAAIEYAIPWIPDSNATIDMLSVEVTTAGSTGAVIRLGLRGESGTNRRRPGAVLLDFGTIDATTTGWKSTTAASVNVTAGTLYYLTAVTQGAPTTPPVVRSLTTGVHPLIPIMVAAGSTGALGLSQTAITGALATWSGSSTIQSIVPWIKAHSV